MKCDPSYTLMLEHLCNLFTNSALSLLLRNCFAVPKIVSWFSVLLFRTEGSDENRKNQFPFTPARLKSFKQHQKQAPRLSEEQMLSLAECPDGYAGELWPSGTSPEKTKEKFWTVDHFQLGMYRMPYPEWLKVGMLSWEARRCRFDFCRLSRI